MAAEVPKQVILRSLDGEEFVLDASVAINSSVTLKNIIEDDCAESVIPLPNVHSSTLTKVLRYWKRHGSGRSDDVDVMKAWDKDFVKMERGELFDVTLEANYLNSKSLMDLLCYTLAEKVKEMSVEDVREYFNVDNDFTKEEEAKIREENAWAFE